MDIAFGWPIGNLLIGAACGYVYNITKGKKHSVLINIAATIISIFVGVSLIKTFIECAIYNLPIIAKFLTNTIAFAMDAIVMSIGVIIAMELPILNQKKENNNAVHSEDKK